MGNALHHVGRFCVRHRIAIVVTWVLVAVCLALAVRVFGSVTSNDLSLPGTGSQAATDVLAARFPPQQNGTSPIIFAVNDGTLTTSERKQAINEAVQLLRKDSLVYSVLNPVSSDGQTAGLLSDNQQTAFAAVLLDVDSGELSEDEAQHILDTATRPMTGLGVEVEAAGSIGSVLSQPETESSEVVGIVAAMVILTLVLGSLVAMGLPIFTAIIGLASALSTIGLLGHFFGVPSIAPTVATMIGLGVGIDYALFLVSRHQDQLATGMPHGESIARAVATSGSAITFAGCTVVIALSALVVADIPLVTSMGFTAALAVVAAVLAAITLLPALLALVGRRIESFSVPQFMRHSTKNSGRGFWAAWSRFVTGRPWMAIALALLLMVPLIIPVVSLRLGQEDVGAAPTNTTERRAYDLITDGFGVGWNGPLLIASVLKPVAAPSNEYQQKYDKATSLQKQLTREQKQLTAQQASLENQQAQLERQQAQLQSQADELTQQQDELLAQEGELRSEQAILETESVSLNQQKQQLQAERDALVAKAESLAVQAARTLSALAANRARQQVVKELIADATNPGRITRLERRLDRIEGRESSLQNQLERERNQAQRLLGQAEVLAQQAEQLQQQGDVLQRQAADLQEQAGQLSAEGASLQAQAADLQEQKSQLESEGASLQRQADTLQREADKANKQKKTAKKLKRDLTQQLTQAGGDDRATDPRIVKVQDAMLATPGIVSLLPPQLSKAGDALVFNAIPATAPSDPATANLVNESRDDVLPAATSEGGIKTYVGGVTASNVDLAAKISDRLLLVIATVLALSCLLLLVAFRSLLVPLQAAISNLLSVAASFGVLTAVFQWGWGLSLVGLDPALGSVPIASYVPLMMFAILFGLSMDYEVFLVSHIVAHHDAGDQAREAVRAGLAGSARVIAAAALIMICVFGSFVLNGDPTVKQFGVGLSVAVFLAALMTLLLAPALLSLFGRATWKLPRWLGRIVPNVGLEE